MKKLLLLSLLLPGLASAQKLKMPPAPGKDFVYDSVAQPAVPLGGTAKYGEFLAAHQKYPAAALQKGTQGTVPVSFVVGRSGSIEEVKVVTPLDPLLDAEALRLIRSGPKWTPARHRGQVVRQRVVIPVSFVASGSETVTLGPKGTAAAPANAADIAASQGTGGTAGGPAVVAPDVPTRPVGGTTAFFDWVAANQKYPDLARKRRIQGKVMVEFMVQPDGRLTDARVLKKMGSGLDEEALRLIRSAPKWQPATYQGRALKQKMVLPVLFQL